LRQARETAIGKMVAEAEQLGVDAVVGVDGDYESIQVKQGGSMLTAMSKNIGPHEIMQARKPTQKTSDGR
jgi:uncharacterized protein YbjQ (UPF0145 family)